MSARRTLGNLFEEAEGGKTLERPDTEDNGGAEPVEGATTTEGGASTNENLPNRTDQVEHTKQNIPPTTYQDEHTTEDTRQTKENQGSSILAGLIKPKERTFHEVHSQETVYINKDLVKRLNKVVAKFRSKDRGFKTKFINAALEKALDEIEAEIEKMKG